MSDPLRHSPAPVPYLLAQLLGEHLVRLEKLERRVAHQGETIKRLVTETEPCTRSSRVCSSPPRRAPPRAAPDPSPNLPSRPLGLIRAPTSRVRSANSAASATGELTLPT
jgi:hypothetical protein